MERIHLIVTADQAEQMASAINAALTAGYETDQAAALEEQVARLRHMAAKARARAARATGG